MRSLRRTAVGLSLALSVVTTPALAQSGQGGGGDRMAPGPPHETNLVVGQLPPTGFVLESLDGESYDLTAARGERPLLLLFFRGTW